MAEYSFDIDCQIEEQEIRNAVDIVNKELSNRFDFKDIDFSIQFIKNIITITAPGKMKIEQLIDCLKDKLIKRKLNVQAFQFGKVEASVSGQHQCSIHIQKGLSQEQCKKINLLVRSFNKKIKTRVQGECLRVTGKSKDELQAIISYLKNQDLDFAISFENLR